MLKKACIIAILGLLPMLSYGHDNKVITVMECSGGYVFKTTIAFTKYVTTTTSVQVLDGGGMGPQPLECKKYKDKSNLVHDLEKYIEKLED